MLTVLTCHPTVSPALISLLPVATNCEKNRQIIEYGHEVRKLTETHMQLDLIDLKKSRQFTDGDSKLTWCCSTIACARLSCTIKDRYTSNSCSCLEVFQIFVNTFGLFQGRIRETIIVIRLSGRKSELRKRKKV